MSKKTQNQHDDGELTMGYSFILDKKNSNDSAFLISYDLISRFGIVPSFKPQSNEVLVNKISKLKETLEVVEKIDDLLALSKKQFPSSKQYLFDVLSEVMQDFYSEEDNAPISIDSLKGMLIFLFSLEQFTEPTISISDSGLFYIDWEKNHNDSLTIRFKNNFMLEYSLFQPSLHTNKLAIRNGQTHVLDFEADIRKLGIKTCK